MLHLTRHRNSGPQHGVIGTDLVLAYRAVMHGLGVILVSVYGLGLGLGLEGRRLEGPLVQALASRVWP